MQKYPIKLMKYCKEPNYNLKFRKVKQNAKRILLEIENSPCKGEAKAQSLINYSKDIITFIGNMQAECFPNSQSVAFSENSHTIDDIEINNAMHFFSQRATGMQSSHAQKGLMIIRDSSNNVLQYEISQDMIEFFIKDHFYENIKCLLLGYQGKSFRKLKKLDKLIMNDECGKQIFAIKFTHILEDSAFVLLDEAVDMQEQFGQRDNCKEIIVQLLQQYTYTEENRKKIYNIRENIINKSMKFDKMHMDYARKIVCFINKIENYCKRNRPVSIDKFNEFKKIANVIKAEHQEMQEPLNKYDGFQRLSIMNLAFLRRINKIIDCVNSSYNAASFSKLMFNCNKTRKKVLEMHQTTSSKKQEMYNKMVDSYTKMINLMDDIRAYFNKMRRDET